MGIAQKWRTVAGARNEAAPPGGPGDPDLPDGRRPPGEKGDWSAALLGGDTASEQMFVILIFK